MGSRDFITGMQCAKPLLGGHHVNQSVICHILLGCLLVGAAFFFVGCAGENTTTSKYKARDPKTGATVDIELPKDIVATGVDITTSSGARIKIKTLKSTGNPEISRAQNERDKTRGETAAKVSGAVVEGVASGVIQGAAASTGAGAATSAASGVVSSLLKARAAK